MDEIDNYLIVCLRFNLHFLNKRIQKVAKKQNLALNEFDLLHLLYCNGEIGVTELKKWIPIGPSYVDIILKKLLVSGYVDRRRNPTDRREVLFKLSEQGMFVMDSLIVDYQKSIAKSFAILTEDDKYNLVNLLKKLGRGYDL